MGTTTETTMAYEIRKMPGSGRYYLHDTIIKRDVCRQWPQHHIMRTWSTEAAARKAKRDLEAKSEPATA